MLVNVLLCHQKHPQLPTFFWVVQYFPGTLGDCAKLAAASDQSCKAMSVIALSIQWLRTARAQQDQQTSRHSSSLCWQLHIGSPRSRIIVRVIAVLVFVLQSDRPARRLPVHSLGSFCRSCCCCSKEGSRIFFQPALETSCFIRKLSTACQASKSLS